jgi:hypothetical protein
MLYRSICRAMEVWRIPLEEGNIKAKRLGWNSTTLGGSHDFLKQKTIDILKQLHFLEVKKSKTTY